MTKRSIPRRSILQQTNIVRLFTFRRKVKITRMQWSIFVLKTTGYARLWRSNSNVNRARTRYNAPWLPCWFCSISSYRLLWQRLKRFFTCILREIPSLYLNVDGRGDTDDEAKEIMKLCQPMQPIASMHLRWSIIHFSSKQKHERSCQETHCSVDSLHLH